jgi:chitin synthase
MSEKKEKKGTSNDDPNAIESASSQPVRESNARKRHQHQPTSSFSSFNRQDIIKGDIPSDATHSKGLSNSGNLRRAFYLSTDFEKLPENPNIKKKDKQPPVTTWVLVTWMLTWWAPSCFLSCGGKDKKTGGGSKLVLYAEQKKILGIRDKNMQQAWREKVSLVQIIIFLCALVGFLTFGFNTAICGTQPNRIRPTGIEGYHIIILGRAFDMRSFRHPTPVPGMPGSGSLQELGVGGRDLSFMFQTVNYNCKGILEPIQGDDDNGNVANYFPCVTIDRTNPQINVTDNPKKEGCHITPKSRIALSKLDVVGDIYYNWTDIRKEGTSLIAFNGYDLSHLE